MTFEGAPSFAFAAGETYTAPYTNGDYATMNADTAAIEKYHRARWMEPQRFENLATFAIWDPWQACWEQYWLLARHEARPTRKNKKIF